MDDSGMNISDRSAASARAHRDHARQCCAIAALGGISVAMLLSGFLEMTGGAAALAARPRLIIAASLICLAAGPLLPARIAIWLAARRPLILSAALGDVALLWAVLGTFALLSGLAMAGLPIWLHQVLSGYEWVASRFLWPRGAMTSLQVSAVVLSLSPALVPLGVTLSFSHRLAAADCSWSLAPLGWALLGAVGGLWVCGLAFANGLSGQGMIMGSSIPVLLVAALAGHRTGHGHRPTPDPPSVDAVLPDLRDRSPWLLRFIASWLGVATAILILTWQQIVRAVQPGPGSAEAAAAVLVVAAGVGLLFGERTKAARWPSLGGLGLAATLTGVVVAAGAALPIVHLSAGFDGDSPAWLASLGVGAAGAALGGFSFAYGHLAVICRVGSRPATGAALLATALAGCAVALLALPDGGPGQRGGFVQLAILALSLAAAGGLAVIHEPDYSARTRRWRLATVAGCVAVMLYGLPLAGRRWVISPVVPVPQNDVAGEVPPGPATLSAAIN